jgi:hypothetical protein
MRYFLLLVLIVGIEPVLANGCYKLINKNTLIYDESCACQSDQSCYQFEKILKRNLNSAPYKLPSLPFPQVQKFMKLNMNTQKILLPENFKKIGPNQANNIKLKDVLKNYKNINFNFKRYNKKVIKNVKRKSPAYLGQMNLYNKIKLYYSKDDKGNLKKSKDNQLVSSYNNISIEKQSGKSKNQGKSGEHVRSRPSEISNTEASEIMKNIKKNRRLYKTRVDDSLFEIISKVYVRKSYEIFFNREDDFEK